MNNLNRFNWIIGVIILISAFSIVYYFYHFSDYGISTQTQDWSNFGGFISPILTLLTIALMIFTIKDIHTRENNTAINKIAEEKSNFELEKMNDILDKLIAYQNQFNNYIRAQNIIRQNQKLKLELKSVNNPSSELVENLKQSEIYVQGTFNLFTEAFQQSSILKYEIISMIELYFKNKIGATIMAYLLTINDIITNNKNVSKQQDVKFTKIFSKHIFNNLVSIIRDNNINVESDNIEYERVLNEILLDIKIIIEKNH